MDHLLMEKCTDMEFSNGMMVNNIMANLETGNSMGKEQYLIRMVGKFKDNG